jgi:hypothetical protein
MTKKDQQLKADLDETVDLVRKWASSAEGKAAVGQVLEEITRASEKVREDRRLDTETIERPVTR